MDLKIISAVTKPLTVNGSNGYVQVGAAALIGPTFQLGATVNLTSTTPLTQNGLQIQNIKGVSGSSDIALYLVDPGNGQPFDASAYTTAATATITQPEQRLWYGVGEDEVFPYTPLTDTQMQALLLAILPGGPAVASNAAITNWPASQPVSLLTVPLPTGAATQATVAAILASLLGTVRRTIRDEVTGHSASVSPGSELLMQTPYRVAGSGFSATSLDPVYWTSSATGSGAVTILNAQANLTTGNTANSTATLLSAQVARHVSGYAERFHSILRMPDTGTPNNERRWGRGTALMATASC